MESSVTIGERHDRVQAVVLALGAFGAGPPEHIGRHAIGAEVDHQRAVVKARDKQAGADFARRGDRESRLHVERHLPKRFAS